MDVEFRTCTCWVSGVELLDQPEALLSLLPFHLFGARTIRVHVLVGQNRSVLVSAVLSFILMRAIDRWYIGTNLKGIMWKSAATTSQEIPSHLRIIEKWVSRTVS